MKLALQIYGQLRSFETALPTLLHFIDYYSLDYDVFLFINKTTNENVKYSAGSCTTVSANFNDANEKKLISLLLPERVKIIKYTDEMTTDEIEFEQNKLTEYQLLWEKFNQKIKGLAKHDIGPALLYRRYLLNNIRLEYQRINNIYYDYVVKTRFDYGTTYTEKYPINSSTTPIIFSDTLSIGTSDFITNECGCILEWPITPKVLFDTDCNLKTEIYKKYESWRGDKFIEKHWIFMPELNQRLYLVEQRIDFIEAWWETPCNYGFKVVRV